MMKLRITPIVAEDLKNIKAYIAEDENKAKVKEQYKQMIMTATKDVSDE